MPGPRQVKNINVYLQPLIDELLELWDGFEMSDASKAQDSPTRKFILHAIATWTIHDYPAYGFCSGRDVLNIIFYLCMICL